MCNAANNKFITLAAAGLLTLGAAVSSCVGGERSAAEELCQKAESEVSSGDFTSAVATLDTLDARYPSQVEVRRSAMKFRAMAVEGLTLKRIQVVDDSLALLKSELDGYQNSFAYVENPGKNLGGNYIAKDLKQSKTTGATSVTPRINDDGYMTVSVRVDGRKTGIRSIAFGGKSERAESQSIGADRSVTVEGSEMAVMQQEEVAALFDALASMTDADRFYIVGASKTVDGRLSAKEREAMVMTWDYARTMQAYRQALIEREKLERRLKVARDQIANLAAVPAEE